MTGRINNRLRAALLGLLLVCGPALAGNLSDPEFRAEVAKRFYGVGADEITPTGIEGLWQIAHGGVIAYITADGRYLLDGDLIDLKTDTNLTAREQRRWRLAQLAQVDEEDMIVYAPDAAAHSVTIFTDAECAYCRALHARIGDLLAAGIEVRYLSYPLAGPGSGAFTEAQKVWCAEDRKQALTRATRDQPVQASPSCENPVEEQYRLATETLALGYTPTIITESGRVLPPGLSIPALIQEITGEGGETQTPDK